MTASDWALNLEQSRRCAGSLTRTVALLFACVVFASPILSQADEAPAADAASTADAKPAEGEEEGQSDETKKLLSQLTISLVADVVDAQTFTVRDAAKAGRQVFRLGNTALPAKGSLSDEEYGEKLEAAKASLSRLVGKQMIWWKAAADEHQPKAGSDDDAEGPTSLVDIWLIDGRHVNGLMKKEGHLEHAEEYQEELAKNILTAQADEDKKKAYKELEEALKESDRYKKEQAKLKEEEQKAEEDANEPLGFGAWVGIASMVVLVLGALFNFGRPPKSKKANLNRKKGMFEKICDSITGKSKGT